MKGSSEMDIFITNELKTTYSEWSKLANLKCKLPTRFSKMSENLIQYPNIIY